MLLEFTAVYEPLANGSIAAYIIEMPGVNTEMKTVEEARAQLAEKLRHLLEHDCEEAVTRLSTGARVEPICVEINVRRETRVEVDAGHETRVEATGANRKQRAAEPDLVQYALALGLINEIPSPESLTEDFAPVPIQGRPLSEEIIKDRR